MLGPGGLIVAEAPHEGAVQKEQSPAPEHTQGGGGGELAGEESGGDGVTAEEVEGGVVAETGAARHARVGGKYEESEEELSRPRHHASGEERRETCRC